MSRAKHGRSQYLDGDPVVIRHAVALVEDLRLNGVVNIQFRDDADGVPRLLEVNLRMAGEVVMSIAGSGVNLPYWSALLALGLRYDRDVPMPTSGLWAASTTAAVSWRSFGGAPGNTRSAGAARHLKCRAKAGERAQNAGGGETGT
jgi:biotin carboxylase